MGMVQARGDQRMRMWLHTILFVLFLTCGGLAGIAQAGPAAGDSIEFNRDIRPVLSDNCFACHGFDPKTRKGKLRLDTAEGAATERENGKPITPGDVEKSL